MEKNISPMMSGPGCRWSHDVKFHPTLVYSESRVLSCVTHLLCATSWTTQPARSALFLRGLAAWHTHAEIQIRGLVFCAVCLLVSCLTLWSLSLGIFVFLPLECCKDGITCYILLVHLRTVASNKNFTVIPLMQLPNDRSSHRAGITTPSRQ